MLYTQTMKNILIAAITALSPMALADDVEIKTLSCHAYNLLGYSRFEMTESSDDLTANTLSTFGNSIRTYRYTGIDAESTFGTTNIPFSKITFIAPDGGGSYAFVFSEPLREENTDYKGTWGQVSALSPFGGPVSYMVISSVSCSIEVVEQPY